MANDAINTGQTCAKKKKLSKQEKGVRGEKIVKANLAKKGYTKVFAVQNGRNQGVDIIALNPHTDEVMVVEVKATALDEKWNKGKMNVLGLNPAQREGGRFFMVTRLRSATRSTCPDLKQSAKDAHKAIRKARSFDPSKLQYKRVDVYITQDGEFRGKKPREWKKKVKILNYE